MPRSIRCSVAALAFALAGAFVAVVPASAQSPAVDNGVPATDVRAGQGYHPQIDPATSPRTSTNPCSRSNRARRSSTPARRTARGPRPVRAVDAHGPVIDGVRTRVVEDRLYLNNVLEERTSDYYAQDRCGNVWYFGEDTAELDSHGNVVSTEGSFHAGVDGAQPGVFMQAHARVGRKFRQEWYAGQAEDMFSAEAVDTGDRPRRRIQRTRSGPRRRPRSNPASSTTSTTGTASANSRRSRSRVRPRSSCSSK